MDELFIALIVLSFLMIGLYLFILSLKMTEKIRGRKISINAIFHDFDKKIWMIAGIGPFFFGCYFLGIYLASLTEKTTRLNIFYFLYQYPVESIYLGLFIFAFITVSIYCLRLVIKYVYNSR